jgi:pimeloyl-ACP methyl ester carboxylesterase
MSGRPTEKVALHLWAANRVDVRRNFLMAAAWRQMMALAGRRRRTGIACPTLVVATSDGRVVPIHHAEMLHHGIPGSRLRPPMRGRALRVSGQAEVTCA